MTSSYDKLADFISSQMRMSHIYQPVMLAELLQLNGRASVTEIAKALLSHNVRPTMAKEETMY